MATVAKNSTARTTKNSTARTTKSKAVSEQDKKAQEKTRDEKRREAFENSLKEINKKFSSAKKRDGDDGLEDGDLISTLGAKPRNVETISTGSLVMNSVLGGGFPKGRVIELFGPEASGKTSMALTAVGNVQARGGNAAFVDLEHALDPNYAKVLGVDTDRLAVSQPRTAEDALNLVHMLIYSQVADIIVVDSIAAMMTRAELEGEAGDTSGIASLARLMSQQLKKIVGIASKTGTTVIFINQLRSKIGVMYGNPNTTTGGQAMKYFASQRIEVKRIESLPEGNKIKIKAVKNKVAPPFKFGETILTYNRGINPFAEMILKGDEYGIIHRPNNRRYESNVDGELIGTSKAEAIANLENNENLYNPLRDALAKILSGEKVDLIDRSEKGGEKAEAAESDSEPDEKTDTNEPDFTVDTETGEILDEK